MVCGRRQVAHADAASTSWTQWVRKQEEDTMMGWEERLGGYDQGTLYNCMKLFKNKIFLTGVTQQLYHIFYKIQ